MQNEFFAGVDVGNYDTKTPNCTFLSGYSEVACPPFGVPADGFIKFRDKYYVLSQQRFPYVQDKTVDEKMAILTLIGIAKEMEAFYLKKFASTSHPEVHTRQAIFETTTIDLGVGLPPSHLAVQKDKTLRYYEEFFGNGVEFYYNGNTYKFRLGALDIYPQNFAVVCATKREPDSIMATYDDYYTLDFGGYTLDKIAIINNRLSIQECDSIEDGIVTLCEKVVSQVRKDKAISLDENAVISILKGKKTVIPADVVEYVKDYTRNWTFEVLNRLSQSGVNFMTRPVVFMGGTALLLKDYIAEYGKICCYEIIENPNANADAYRKLIKLKVQSGK